MKPITYLCFTLLSIAIQFCLMDFINEQMGVDSTVIDLNNTNKELSSIFQDLKQKPHALFYKTERFQIKNKSPIQYNNVSITESLLTSSTELPNTVIDLLYDDNVSVTDSDSTTETFITSSDYDNVTEITFFDKTPSTEKPIEIPKNKSTRKCYCDLLYKACDTNCCCDNDCSDLEKNVMKNCEKIGKVNCERSNKDNLNVCSSQFACKEEAKSNLFGYLFCIEKSNLPVHRQTKTVYALDINNILKWHVITKERKIVEFSKNPYKIGEPIWIITNGTIKSLELPVTVINEYCNGYKAVDFLKNEYIKCYVRLKDLHMLDVIKKFEKTKIASPKEITLNSTKVDCTTLHCINWTVLMCDDHKCFEYDNKLHEPSCSESHCFNIGNRIEYEFYCNVSLITKAVVKFHIRIVPMTIEFVTQEVTVNFFMGNNSIQNIVKLSGAPGYIRGLPIIVSRAESNHTDNFFNSSSGKNNYLLFPDNKDGECVLTNLTHNILKFGYNKRIKCRTYFGQNFTIHNGTHGCLNMQATIYKLCGIRPNTFISPLGNPQDISDENWVHVQNSDKINIYGEYRRKDSELLCYNLATRIAFIIAFASTNEDNEVENKILSVMVNGTSKNVTFSMEDLSTVITIDTIYVDVSKPSLQEYFEAPHLNFRFPKELFYPLASSKGSTKTFQMHYYYICVMRYILYK